MSTAKIFIGGNEYSEISYGSESELKDKVAAEFEQMGFDDLHINDELEFEVTDECGDVILDGCATVRCDVYFEFDF